MCVTINKMTKGIIVLSLLCYISQELSLSTNPVVLKQGKLQHDAVYIMKFRMTSTRTEYLMTCIMQFWCLTFADCRLQTIVLFPNDFLFEHFPTKASCTFV